MGSKYKPHIDVSNDIKQEFKSTLLKLSSIREEDVKQADLVKEMLDLYIKEQKRRYRKW